MRARRRLPLLIATCVTLLPAAGVLAVSDEVGTATDPAEEVQAGGTDTSAAPLGEVTRKRIRTQVTGGFTTAPSRLTDTVPPGEARDFEVSVLNQTGQTKTFQVGINDLAPGKGDTATDLAEPGTQPFGAAEWVELAADDVTLDNGEQATIPIRVSAPADAEPGGHYAAIVVFMGEGGAEEVRVITQIVTQVVAIVPGDIRYRPRVGEVDAPRLARGSVPVSFTVRNDGNIHTRPRATLRFDGPLASETINHDVPELLPGGESEIELEWKDPPLLGRFVPEVTLASDDGTRQRRSGDPVWVWSWQAVAAAVGLLALLVAGIWRGRATRSYLAYLDDEDVHEDQELG